MPDTAQPKLDVSLAHQHFAASCFNTMWELIEKPNRTEADIEEMIGRCHASRWHWMQRRVAKPQNLAVATWALARVYALAGRLDEARRYANQYMTMCQEHKLAAFDLAFAHEALARIEGLAGNTAQRDVRLAAARAAMSQLTDPEDLNWLNANLDPLTRGQHDWPVKV